jgi:predicted DNA-binding transcriptional regulator AlpA
MHPLYLREKARKLRRERLLTIDELAECLALPRTTIYYWVRDLPIPLKARAEWPQNARLAASRAMQKKYRLLREAAYAEGCATFANLAADPTFRDFVNLYMAEGYKRDRNVVSVSNSDPTMIKLVVHWIRRLTARKVSFQLAYHADQDIDALRAFWASQLGVQPTSITVSRKSNSNQLTGRRWRSRYGVLAVTTSDTYLRAKLEAWMAHLREQWLHSISSGCSSDGESARFGDARPAVRVRPPRLSPS